MFGAFFMFSFFSAAILSPADQDFFLHSLDLSLSAREAELCEGEVTLEECPAALNSFKRNKSPGIDGLPYEFYQCFWDILGCNLVMSLMTVFLVVPCLFPNRLDLLLFYIRRMISWT